MTPTFSVVMPTYNRAEVVERTLRHLAAQDYPRERYEVLVADNSTDGTAERAERVAAETGARIRVLRLTDRLPAVKRNAALRAAEGELMLFMNDDIWAAPDFLREHARTHGEHAGEPIAVLGHVEQSGEMPPTAFLEWYRPFAYQELEGRDGQAVEWRYFWSINVSLARSEMLGRGLCFHEDWAEIGHEDVELGYRWARAGRRLFYNPRARGDHFHPHTLDSACRLQASIGRGLRDLEVLVPEPGLLERYGVWSLSNSPRAVLRGAVRELLFNRATTPPVKRWLERRPRNSALTRRLYWKVLLRHTNDGYRSAAPRRPVPLPIGPVLAPEGGAGAG